MDAPSYKPVVNSIDMTPILWTPNRMEMGWKWEGNEKEYPISIGSDSLVGVGHVLPIYAFLTIFGNAILLPISYPFCDLQMLTN